LTVALGKNQARMIDWGKEESLTVFYNRLKSRLNYVENPADHCMLVEKNQKFTF
jgi:hypothetical protein